MIKNFKARAKQIERMADALAKKMNEAERMGMRVALEYRGTEFRDFMAPKPRVVHQIDVQCGVVINTTPE